MTSATPRDVALDALVKVDDGAYANVLLPTLLRSTGLEPRERAQTTDLVYGTLRRRRALDALLEPLLDRDLDDLDAPVRAALRLGAYQLVDGVPAHAAVSETVGAVARVAPRAKGYANAVLRRLSEVGPPWPWPEGDDQRAVGIRTSMPDWIVARLFADLGPRAARAALEQASEPAALTLRANRRRTTPDQLAAELDATGERRRTRRAAARTRSSSAGEATPESSPPWPTAARRPRTRGARRSPRPWAQWRESGCWRWGPRPVGRPPRSRRRWMIAVSSSRWTCAPSRLALVDRAAVRLGLDAVDSVAADGRALPFRPATFDRVLVDAPCSGLGVLRRRPEARWRIQAAAVDELAVLQRELLAAAAALVRPGGRLVYSVCTLTAAETITVDDWARTALPELVAEPPPAAPWREWGRGALLLPQAAGTDGMYLLTLTRSGGTQR